MLQDKPPFYSIQYEDYSYTSCLGLNFFYKEIKTNFLSYVLNCYFLFPCSENKL